jgi:hypothetical protein
MELSLPDMPFGMGGRCACGRARRRALPSPRCTGEVTFGELVDDLVKRYAAPREKILADVDALLRGLADKKLLEL